MRTSRERLMLRALWNNVGTLILAFLLAVLVWVVAVNEENPIEERTLTQGVPVEIVRSEDMILMDTSASRVQVTLRAPRQSWSRLSAQQVHVTANVEGLEPGTWPVALAARVDLDGARVVDIQPAEITVTIERSDTRQVPVEVEITGEPAAGYEAEQPVLEPESVTVSGPAPAVARVSRVEARLSLEGLKRDYIGPVALAPVDADGNAAEDVTITPESVQVHVPVTQKQGFREVAVKVVITGEVASGYQVTNISVAPSIITVGSSDPRLVQQMPGFVNTQPLDISDASDDVVRRLPLELPDGVTVVDGPTVVVQVSIAAIEYSATIARSLEMRGLGAGLSAAASPDTVDVILLGPLPVLDDLTLQDVRVVLNLSGLPPGTYQVVPQVELLPAALRAENVLPSQIEVVISPSTPTPTFAPVTATAAGATPGVVGTSAPSSPSLTRTPTPTATRPPGSP